MFRDFSHWIAGHVLERMRGDGGSFAEGMHKPGPETGRAGICQWLRDGHDAATIHHHRALMLPWGANPLCEPCCCTL